MSPSLLLIALQVATPSANARPTSPEPPVAQGERFSILVQPCVPDPAASPADVVVCGRNAANSQRLPLPQFRGPPDRPMPMNPDMKASVALDEPEPRAECGGYGEDCPVAGGNTVQSAVLGAVAGAAQHVLSGKPIFPRKPDRSGRVAIDLDAPPPTGRLLP